MAYKRKESNEDIKERVRARGKKFVSYAEGAELYSVGLHTFQKIAKEAGAIYRLNRRVLVNTEIVDEYMEMFPEF